MKNDCGMLGVTALVLSALFGILFAVDAHANNDFYRAIEKGATVRLTTMVVDDEGKPVNGVKIEVRFDAAFNAPGEQKSFITGTNGIAVVEGRTGKAVSLKATKVGYYGAMDEICYVSMGQGSKGGMWLPLDLKRIVILRRIKNPVAKMPQVSCARYTKNIGNWIGFDIEKYDFVAPDGNGVYADMEIKFDWDGQRGNNFHGMDVGIRFLEPYSGAYYQGRVMTSDFKDAYFAATNGTYQKVFEFYSHPVRNERGEIIKREQKFFDSTKSLIVRSRCVVNDDGTLKQARYSEISDLTFGCGDKGAWVMFQPIYNPTPNDTNLEPKR